MPHAIADMKLETILIAYPLSPLSLVDRLREVYKTVHFYPQLSQIDYTSKAPPLPPASVLAESDTILCFNLPSNLVHISQTPNLKLLQLVGSGTYQVTSGEFYKSIPEENPLVLANASGIATSSIGEHVIMSVLALTHKLQAIQAIGQGEQRWAAPSELGGLFVRELRTQTVGILGYGHLGREVARLMNAFGARVVACTRDGRRKPIEGYHIDETGDPDAIIPKRMYQTSGDSLYAFLGDIDILVNTLPLSDDTRHFMGAAEFSAMRNSAIVVNVGRGGTMDHAALVQALQAPGERSLATGALMLSGAALDVTEPEPLPAGHALFTMPNVILTPHISYASSINFVRAVDLLEQNKARWEDGRRVLNGLRG